MQTLTINAMTAIQANAQSYTMQLHIVQLHAKSSWMCTFARWEMASPPVMTAMMMNCEQDELDCFSTSASHGHVSVHSVGHHNGMQVHPGNMRCTHRGSNTNISSLLPTARACRQHALTKTQA